MRTMPLARSQRAQQECVYEAAKSLTAIRCGDPVECEWENTWYAGIVTDVPSKGNLAIAYSNGDFEDSVPDTAVRMRHGDAEKRPLPTSSKGRRGDKNPARLTQAANHGDIGLVLQALRDGVDPRAYDEHGYMALHWAASPDEGMPGDTISRRKCIAILAKLCDFDAPDKTTYALRGAQHSVTRNFVGCLKTFAHVGADLRGTVHWAVHTRAHGALRELLRLGVAAPARRDEWEGCTPMMMASAMNDVYCLGLLVETEREGGGEEAVVTAVNAVQANPKLRACPLHHAADAGADTAVSFLLEHNADPTTRNAKGDTAAAVARKRAAAAKPGPNVELYEASLRCASLLDEAVAKAKEQRRAKPSPAAGSGTGRRKVSKAEAAAREAREAAEAEAAAAAAEATAEGMAVDDDDDDDVDDDDVEDEESAMDEGAEAEAAMDEDADLWDRPLGELLELLRPDLPGLEVAAGAAADGAHEHGAATAAATEVS